MDKKKKLQFSSQVHQEAPGGAAGNDELKFKRPREEGSVPEDHPPPKKRGFSSKKPSGTGSRMPSLISLPDEQSSHVSHDVQCAYYAIERLSAAWYVTHSTVILLEGESSLNPISRDNAVLTRI